MIFSFFFIAYSASFAFEAICEVRSKEGTRKISFQIAPTAHRYSWVTFDIDEGDFDARLTLWAVDDRTPLEERKLILELIEKKSGRAESGDKNFGKSLVGHSIETDDVQAGIKLQKNNIVTSCKIAPPMMSSVPRNKVFLNPDAADSQNIDL